MPNSISKSERYRQLVGEIDRAAKVHAALKKTPPNFVKLNAADADLIKTMTWSEIRVEYPSALLTRYKGLTIVETETPEPVIEVGRQ